MKQLHRLYKSLSFTRNTLNCGDENIKEGLMKRLLFIYTQYFIDVIFPSWFLKCFHSFWSWLVENGCIKEI